MLLLNLITIVVLLLILALFYFFFYFFIFFFYSSSSDSYSSVFISLDYPSALLFSFPLLCFISKSYCCNSIIHLAFLPFVGIFAFFNVFSALWSVIIINFFPIKYL